MAMDEKEILGGVAALLVVLVVGAVFGRVHGSENAPVKALGDRVACGLLALPLISIAVFLAFPAAGLAWALAAPAPMLLYTGLLAGVDARWSLPARHFTAVLFAGTCIIYVLMAMAAWLGHA